jgi:Trk K+ transport system NAD-binding subunit
VIRHVVLCGLGKVGWRVLDSLRSGGRPVTVIDLHATGADPALAGVTVVRGDCRKAEVLERAGVPTAAGVVIVTSDDLVNVSTALLARKLNPDARVVVRMFNQTLISRLGAAVRNTVALSVSALTAPLVALIAVTGESLAAFQVGDRPQQIARVQVPDGSALVGERVSDVAARHQLLVLGHTRGSDQTHLLHAVTGDTPLAAGDALVVCGSPAALEPLLSDGAAGASVTWANGLRRTLRTARRALAEVDTLVKLASVTLFVTLFVSVLVFRFGVGLSWADGLYQTVSVAATGSDLRGENQDGWVKVFLSVLKLVGAALLAAFTAVFTNYLLKARLRGVFEERRMPDGGHVVVCGLGNVGFRCVQELLRLGVKVVAVERAADTPFAATVRRMGAAVVIGDATVPEVLKQARADKARAVVAVTSNELANLEIALLVRELNPTQRVVVRITDPEFAQTARDAADLKYAVSPPALAAPAFAAALLGDRVQALLNVGARTLAVVEFVAEPGDRVTDRTLHELMVDYRLLPVGLAGREPFAAGGIPKGHRVAVGDRLTAVMEQADLERMLGPDDPPAEWAVLIDEAPLTAKGELVVLVRTARGCSQQEAEQLVGSKAFRVVDRVSRGQAEELTARLTREKVIARVVPAG